MMSKGFDAFLENIDQGEQFVPEAVVTTPEAVPTGPVDPYAHLVGHTGPIQAASPFDAFLDQVEAEATEEEKVVAEDKPFENHNWKAVRASLYEDDHDVWLCTKCFRQINVMRNQTLNQALDYHKVNPDCGVQIAAEVMES